MILVMILLQTIFDERIFNSQMHFKLLICLQFLLLINLYFIEGNLDLNERVAEKCRDHFKAFMPKFHNG